MTFCKHKNPWLNPEAPDCAPQGSPLARREGTPIRFSLYPLSLAPDP